MNFKSITWVGNVYQKFEAMCLEVEEVIVQDTVTYMENQVQTVGASVKKFYSDVVQDLLPPSSVDPVKGALVSEFTEDQHSTDCAVEKKLEDVTEENVKLDHKKLTDGSKRLTARYSSISHATDLRGVQGGNNTFHRSIRKSANGVCSDLYSRQCTTGSIYKKSGSGFDKNNGPKTKTSGTVTHIETKILRAPTSCNFSGQVHEASNGQKSMNSTPVSVEVSRRDLREQNCCGVANDGKCFPGTPTNTSSPPTDTLINSVGNNFLEISCANSHSSSADSNASDIRMDDVVASREGISVNVHVPHDVIRDKVELVSHPGHSNEVDSDAVKKRNVVEHERENIQHFNNVRVDESCILVNKDELQFVSNKETKLKPYKKIRNTISSRMKKGRKQEYEQLAYKWYENDVKTQQERTPSPSSNLTMMNPKSFPSNDTLDSEWELL